MQDRFVMSHRRAKAMTCRSLAPRADGCLSSVSSDSSRSQHIRWPPGADRIGPNFCKRPRGASVASRSLKRSVPRRHPSPSSAVHFSRHHPAGQPLTLPTPRQAESCDHPARQSSRKCAARPRAPSRAPGAEDCHLRLAKKHFEPSWTSSPEEGSQPYP